MGRAQKPIGIFDSGVGGLTVMEAIVKLLPYESVIYYADSGHCPYGEKSREEIFELASGITGFLVDQGCKIIVVACNTITTNIIDDLRKRYALPFVGMEPAIKPAAAQSMTGKVAVLATQGTLNGKLYLNTSRIHASGVEVFNLTGTGLVDLIEENQIDSPVMREKLSVLIEPILAKDVDTLVLGCTHYNYLIPSIRKITGDRLRIINSAEPVARRVKAVLTNEQLLNRRSSPSREIYTTGIVDTLNAIVRRLALGKVEVKPVNH